MCRALPRKVSKRAESKSKRSARGAGRGGCGWRMESARRAHGYWNWFVVTLVKRIQFPVLFPLLIAVLHKAACSQRSTVPLRWLSVRFLRHLGTQVSEPPSSTLPPKASERHRQRHRRPWLQQLLYGALQSNLRDARGRIIRFHASCFL